MKARCRVGSSKAAAGILSIPHINGPAMLKRSADYPKGMFIGFSEGYSLPCFVNFDLLINPHIFIAGMTGSGKTYLMRNLMLRLSVVLGCSILLIDFTGEYKEFVESVGRKEMEQASLEGRSFEIDGGITYINLRGRADAEKVAVAKSLLDGFVAYMRSREFDGRHTFVILDEAWKLLSSCGSLEILLREGRKYGVGLVMASQLVEDVELSLLGNVATLFMFRVQNKQSLDSIARNYAIGDALISRVQNLDVGSCLLVQLYKNDARDAFIVRRVLGVNLDKRLSIILGDGTDVEISKSAFEAMVKNLCGEKGAGILMGANDKGYVELHRLIAELIAGGAGRWRVLASLRKLGIDDSDLALGFAAAVEEFGGAIEERTR